MQPCSREMQGINSLLTSLQDLHSNHHQIQNSQIQMHPSSSSSHFDSSSHDDFLDQILSSVPSSSWSDPKPFWDLHPSNNPRDISDAAENAVFHQFEDHASLASKFRNHQISTKSSTAATAALMLQAQQQLLMSRGVSGAGDSALLPMPLSLGGGDFDRSRNNVVDGSSFKSPNPGGDGSVQTLFNGMTSSLQASNQTQHFPHPQNFAASGSAAPNQAPAAAAAAAASGGPAQPRQRVRARRGQATDPHSIAERLRRERIAERMKALQELVPNANKTDKASMLDEIIDYVKFLQLQVKVLSMSRLGGAAAVAPLVADMSSDQGRGGGASDCMNGAKASSGGPNGNNQTASSSSNDTEQQVAKLMEEDMGSAMQYLQGKGLCLMPISLATAISTATCHSRNPLAVTPSSPTMSVLTVQSATLADASVSKP